MMITNSNTNAYAQMEEIKSLLEHYFNEEMTIEQRHELAKWLMMSRENRNLFLRLKDKKNLYLYWKQNQKIDAAREYDLLSKRINAKSNKKLLVKKLVRLSACAAVLVLLYVGVVELSNSNMKQRETVAVVEEIPAKVTFHSADGEVVVVDDNVVITNLVAEKKKEATKTKEMKYNEVVVPEGLESRFTLSDGTLVYMNSSSSLRFPESFSNDVRQVEFKGEVYFQVKRDSLCPFIVQSGDFSVNVLGTTFIARADGANYSAVLSEGSVNLKYKEQSLLLTPGEKGALTGGVLVASEANLEKEFDWVNGCYLFENETLETITKKLTQFYGTEFIFVNDGINAYRFTGKIVREKGVEEAIRTLEMMNVVKFHKNEKSISITKNR